jgi:hypothetical protein
LRSFTPVEVLDIRRWFRFLLELLSLNVIGVEFNDWLFVVFSPLGLRRNVLLEVSRLLVIVIVLNIWRWLFLFNVVGSSGYIIPVNVNDGGFVLLSPDNWSGFVHNEGLGGFMPLVVLLNVWGRFFNVVVILSSSVIDVELDS